MVRNVIIFLLVLILSGCMTKSSHTKDGDMIVARLARAFAQTNPQHPDARSIAFEAGQHAQQNPGLISTEQTMGFVGSLGRGDFIGAGMSLMSIVAGAYGLRKRSQAKQIEDVAITLTERDKSESQAIADAHPLLAKRRKKVV